MYVRRWNNCWYQALALECWTLVVGRQLLGLRLSVNFNIFRINMVLNALNLKLK